MSFVTEKEQAIIESREMMETRVKQFKNAMELSLNRRELPANLQNLNEIFKIATRIMTHVIEPGLEATKANDLRTQTGLEQRRIKESKRTGVLFKADMALKGIRV